MSSESQDTKSYLDINELVARTGLSEATIWRLKRAGKIPFFQPGGKGGRVKFPADAIEVPGQGIQPTRSESTDSESTERLPGPLPKWMSARPTNNENN